MARREVVGIDLDSVTTEPVAATTPATDTCHFLAEMDQEAVVGELATVDVSYDYCSSMPSAEPPNEATAPNAGIALRFQCEHRRSGDLRTWTTNGTVVDQNSSILQVHDDTPVIAGTNRFIRLRVSDP